MKFRFAVLFILMSALPARGVDCIEATAPLDKAVCANPDLQNDDMIAASQAALKPLSKGGKAMMERGKESWQKYVALLCHLDGTGFPKSDYDDPDAPSDARSACLSDAYSRRIEQLQNASPRFGPYQFLQVSGFVAVRKSSGDVEGYELVVPKIDAPHTDATDRWNREIYEKHSAFLLRFMMFREGDGVRLTPKVTYAGPNFISVTDTWTVQGWKGERASATTVLLKPFRDLAYADVFKDPPDIMRPVLQKLVRAQIAMDGMVVMPLQVTDKAIADFVSANRWTIEKDGLGIQFDIDELSSEGASREAIPWRV